MTTVSSGARLHIGFQNLSLAHRRLYGGIGMMVTAPRVTVSAHPEDNIICDHDRAQKYARRAADLLDVPGATVTVHESLPAHQGLGSGTQLALTVYSAIAQAYDLSCNSREAAPALGRGGRSGVGVGVFEHGGMIVDAGHPTSMFTGDPPERGNWTVPPVIANHPAPANWRVAVVIPDIPPGRSGTEEDQSIRAIIEQADPTIADRISTVLSQQLLPGWVTGDIELTGKAINRIGQLNGSWYSREQGGVYRPSIASLIADLQDCEQLTGIGQSSWGPTVFGLTTAENTEVVQQAIDRALNTHNLTGDCYIASIDNRGVVYGADQIDYR